MKMVAASKMKQDVQRLERAKAYGVGTVQRIINNETYLTKKKANFVAKKWLLVPSPVNRELFVTITHEQFGHCGHDKLRELLAKQYWWPKTDSTIVSCLVKCIPCMKSKKYKTYPKSELYPTEKGFQPF